MIVAAFVMDADTGETLSTFGYEVDPLDRGWHPERWCLARRYTVPATGPAGHSWPAWSGAVAILLAVALVLGRAL